MDSYCECAFLINLFRIFFLIFNAESFMKNYFKNIKQSQIFIISIYSSFENVKFLQTFLFYLFSLSFSLSLANTHLHCLQNRYSHHAVNARHETTWYGIQAEIAKVLEQIKSLNKIYLTKKLLQAETYIDYHILWHLPPPFLKHSFPHP